jgi:hypothetical protein
MRQTQKERETGSVPVLVPRCGGLPESSALLRDEF